MSTCKLGLLGTLVALALAVTAGDALACKKKKKCSAPCPAPVKVEPAKAPPLKKAEAPAAAKLIVAVPADAKLFVGDQLLTSTSDKREFISPPLDPEDSYSYTFRVEVVRNGQLLTVTRKVFVEAGDEIEVDLSKPATALAAK